MNYVSAAIFGAMIGWGLAAFMWSPMLDRWINAYEGSSERLTYYSEGAANRGMLDICDKAGVQGVYFKDECDSK